MNVKNALTLITFFSSLGVLASQTQGAGAHGGSSEVPLATIFYQSVNFLIIVAGLFYFLKTPIKKYFLDKKQVFVSTAEKSKLAKEIAEKEHHEIKVQLTKLESTADETISRAHAEAADLKKNLIKEAEAMSLKIKQEAILTASIESERAKKDLRIQLIQEATVLAKKQIQERTNSDEQIRLQKEFIKNIEAVKS